MTNVYRKSIIESGASILYDSKFRLFRSNRVHKDNFGGFFKVDI